MRLPPGIVIEALGESECDEFFQYLNDHRSDNGKGAIGYFIPSPKSESRFSDEKQKSYRDGLRLAVGSLGWRRTWVARAAASQIVGHIDLWSHPVRFAEHRCLLGMGVERGHRRVGLGAALLAHASAWAHSNTSLEWLDLHVLSSNASAIRLYIRAGFVKMGEMPDMFKFDSKAFSDITMTKRLRQVQYGTG
jgi:ribosomal protein S18 acetylase RimI-like enzyme